jgi:hypothetical protein
MTLLVSPGSITIENSAGVPKFNSNNKLLYRKNLFNSNDITLNSSSSMQVFALPGAAFDANTFAIINITIVSCNGSFGSSYVNSTIDLSSPVLLHFEYSTTQVRILHEEVISGAIQRNSGPNDLQFLVSYLDIHSSYPIGQEANARGFTSPPSRSVTIRYQIQFFGWK